MTQERSERWINVLFWAWYLLFLPWFPFAIFAGTIFEGKHTFGAYAFVASLYSYPIVVLIAAAFYHKSRLLVLLPCLNLIGFFIWGI